MTMPITLAVITSTFPDEERSRGIGVWTAVAGGGGLLGMYLSALLDDVADQRELLGVAQQDRRAQTEHVRGRLVPGQQQPGDAGELAVGEVVPVLAHEQRCAAIHGARWRRPGWCRARW